MQFHESCTANATGTHREELVQTCASVPLQDLEYLLLEKYDENEYDIIALDFMEM